MDEDTRSLLARRHVLAVGLALTGFAFLILALLVVLNSLGWGFDFDAYYLAAYRLAKGDPLYHGWMLEEAFRAGPFGYYMYAPPLAVVLLPFTALSVPAATVAWFLLKVVFLALACWAMPVRSTVRLLTFAVGAFTQPVLSDMALGNVSVLVVAALAFTWRGLDRPMGSVAAAVAMSVRPTLGVLLLWWAIRRRWLALLSTMVSGSVLVLATIPFVGLGAYVDYLTMLRNVSQVTGVTNNLDLASTMLRLDLDPIVATAALYAGYGVAIGAMLLSLRHDRDLSFMVTISATMLLAPLLWGHYLSSLLLPAAFLAHRGRTWGLALPLLGWLPAPLLPLVAIVGTIAPFLAERRPGIDPPALAWRRRPTPEAGVSADAGRVPSADGPPEPDRLPERGPYPAGAPVVVPVLTGQAEVAAGSGSKTTSSPG